MHLRADLSLGGCDLPASLGQAPIPLQMWQALDLRSLLQTAYPCVTENLLFYQKIQHTHTRKAGSEEKSRERLMDT